jgi:hypothetical protein
LTTPAAKTHGPFTPTGELRAYHPSLFEGVKHSLTDAGLAAGMKRLDAQHFGEAFTNLLSVFVAPVGVPMALDDTQRAARRGDVISTVAAAIGAIPSGRFGKAVTRVASAAENTGKAAIRHGSFSISDWTGYKPNCSAKRPVCANGRRGIRNRQDAGK